MLFCPRLRKWFKKVWIAEADCWWWWGLLQFSPTLSTLVLPLKSWNQNQTENQYRVCPPLAAVAALILLWIELTKAKFTLYRADGRRRVYRRRGERFADACVVERDRFGGGSVMVSGGIAHGIKSQLIIVAGNMSAIRYRDEILRPVAVPLVQLRNLILQQDNARPHVARVCQDFLANNNIAPLAWPPYSPDLTPIEHMWDELDRRVRKRRNPPATLAQLRNALIDEWNNIPMRTVKSLVNSIQRRITAATAARGGHTRYWFSDRFWFQDLGGSYQLTSITRDLLITNQWNLELLFHTCTVL